MSYRQKLSAVFITVLLIALNISCVLFAAGESSMSADNIQYNVNTKKIVASGNVIIKRMGSTLWGDKGEGNTENSEFFISGNVKGSFPAENTELKADRVKWFRSENKKSDGLAEAIGNVRLTRGDKERLNAGYVSWEMSSSSYIARGNVDAVIEGQILIAEEAGRSGSRFWAKKVKRYENIKSKVGITADVIEGKMAGSEVMEAIATGKVSIDYVDKERLKTIVTGTKAVYSKTLGTVVLSGEARAVRDDGKTVAADTIVLHEKTKNIEAIGNSRITFFIDDKKEKGTPKPKVGE